MVIFRGYVKLPGRNHPGVMELNSAATAPPNIEFAESNRYLVGVFFFFESIGDVPYSQNGESPEFLLMKISNT